MLHSTKTKRNQFAKPTNKAYTMAGRDLLAGLGSAVIETRLRRMRGPSQDARSTVVNVFNVEGIKEYQKQDIDIVVHVRNSNNENRTEVVTIEVKADNYPSGDVEPGSLDDMGNFFFETISNDSKQIRTQGCFMYTNSRMLYYLFLPTGTLYQLPTSATRDWFKKEMGYTEDWYHPGKCDLQALRSKDSRWRFTSTSIGGRVAYNTWGVVLPVKQVIRDVQAFTGRTIKKQDVLEDVVRVAHSMGVLDQVWEKMPEKTRIRSASFLAKHELPFPPAEKYIKRYLESKVAKSPSLMWDLHYKNENNIMQVRKVCWSNWETLSWNPDLKVFEFGGSRGHAGVITRMEMDTQYPGMVDAYITAKNLGLSKLEVVSHMKQWWSSQVRFEKTTSKVAQPA